jgi:hypothetical protein
VRWRFIVAVTLAGTVLGVGAPACALTFTRHPWLNLQTETSILIAWQTDAVGSSSVLYGPDPVDDWSTANVANGVGAQDHAVTLTGLTPATAYRYKVVSDQDTLDAGTFHTAPESSAPFRFLAFGDIGRATFEQKAIAARVDSLNADLAILTGDIIYDSGEDANFTPQYFDIYRPTLKRIPFYPSLGNHDNNPPSYGIPYLNNFYLPTNYPTAPERCYSFDFGNAHFVAIEVYVENQSLDPTMMAWLDADLAASAKRWKFVFFHVPAYSNQGAHGGDPAIAASLEPIVTARGVDMVFQGHNHFYTRTYPIASGVVVDQAQDPNYVNPRGPIYIVAGGGGRALYALNPLTPIEAVSQSVFHTAVVDVDGDSLMLRAVGMDGTVFDTMTFKKGTTTAIEVAAFTAASDPEGVRLRWRANGTQIGTLAFNVYRAAGSEEPVRINGALLLGGTQFEYLDRTAVPGRTYRYKLGIVENGIERLTGEIEGIGGRPYTFMIGKPRPNPSGGPTRIDFTLARASTASVRIVDVNGRAVRTIQLGTLAAGPQRVIWDGRDDRGREVTSRRYFIVIRTADQEARTPLTLIR